LHRRRYPKLVVKFSAPEPESCLALFERNKRIAGGEWLMRSSLYRDVRTVLMEVRNGD
jgi:hypothetical protein